jgi:hypothetical protein
MSVVGLGCVKTRLGEGCAELFSQSPSSERSCQYNRLPHRRNRDGSSTRKLDIGVFTQPGSNSEVGARNRLVRFPPDRDQTADIAGGPFRAKFGSRCFHSNTSSARASSVGGTVSPSALAVLRLMVSSNLVGCSMGSSAGLTPLRILSIKLAARKYRSG